MLIIYTVTFVVQLYKYTVKWHIPIFESVYFFIRDTAMQQHHQLFTMAETGNHFKLLIILLHGGLFNKYIDF